MIKSQNFIKAWNNKKLVAGVLKTIGVQRQYHNYEDLLNEGIILYAECLEALDTVQLAAKDKDKIAFTKIKWRIIDQLRKHKKYNEQQNIADYPQISFIIPQHDNFLLLQDEIKSMSPTERLIFSQHWINNKTISEISQQYNLSRSTLQRNKAALRLRLREKLQD